LLEYDHRIIGKQAAEQERMRTYMTGLLVLTENEKSFLNAFRAKEYKPELLFDGERLNRVVNHPMALWKMQEHGDR
jgi:hypothetical protein